MSETMDITKAHLQKMLILPSMMDNTNVRVRLKISIPVTIYEKLEDFRKQANMIEITNYAIVNLSNYKYLTLAHNNLKKVMAEYFPDTDSSINKEVFLKVDKELYIKLTKIKEEYNYIKPKYIYAAMYADILKGEM